MLGDRKDDRAGVTGSRHAFGGFWPPAAIALGLLLAGCGEDEVADFITEVLADDVEIRRFSAEPEQISLFETATLSWRVSDATTCAILPDVGFVDSDEGTVLVMPQRTTDYELSCERLDSDDEVESSDRKTLTVTVGP